MYCGDETGAFVGDCGFSTCRFGYGGEDCPKQVLPSHVLSDFSSFPSPYTSPSSSSNDTVPIFNHPSNPLTTNPHDYVTTPTGLISSHQAYETAWQTAFTTLRVRDSHKQNLPPDVKCPHPILSIDSGHVSDDIPKQRETLLEFFFETLEAPAVFLAPSPMLQAFSMGRQTGLVLDMGGGGCRATPVVDGLIARDGQRRNGMGGAWLENVQLEALKLMGVEEVRPRYSLKKSWKEGQEVKEGFHRFAVREVMYEMKTGWHVRVTPFRESEKESGGEEEDEDDAEEEKEKKVFELPDGTQIDLTKAPGKMLCCLPDLLFEDNPLQHLNLPTPQTPPPTLPSPNRYSQTISTHPIHKLLHASLTSVDPDLRKELCGNILLCGSHSSFDDLDRRLSCEMAELIPSSYKARVVAPKNTVERKFAGWIGGSVLTSLGSFQQLWLSKAEYEEYGAMLGCQRFPW